MRLSGVCQTSWWQLPHQSVHQSWPITAPPSYVLVFPLSLKYKRERSAGAITTDVHQGFPWFQIHCKELNIWLLGGIPQSPLVSLMMFYFPLPFISCSWYLFVPCHCTQLSCGLPHTYMHSEINIIFTKPKLSLQSFQSAFTMGPVHEPSHSKGRGNNHDTNLVPNVGPMLCGHSATFIQQPGFHPSLALALPTANWYREADQHPTSKSQTKLVSSSWERVWKLLTFARCLTAWRLAAEWREVTLFMLILDNFVHVYHLDKLCLCFNEGRTLPKLPPWGTEACGDWYGVFPKGTNVRIWPSKKDPFHKGNSSWED